ncbi:MAG: hypothetical protein JST26_11715 [Bacteroidetes bacterium]|nr:hypothetical protein [Bacteroidota bacterium]
MLIRIRKSRYFRGLCFFLALNILSEIIQPNVAMALTSGPSQPEVQSFEPINTSDMVDIFTGDFKYNIPLMDVGGYPLNIAYNSGIGMDQEASWTGLGWNLNVGSINRNMRGIPDDFDGDEVEKEFNMKDNITYGGHVSAGFEIFGWGGKGGGSKGSGNLSVGIGVSYNNYTGIGIEQNANFALSAGNSGKGSMNAGLGIKSSASEGLSISPSVSFSYKMDEKQKNDVTTTTSACVGVGATFNSRAGLKDVSVNASVNVSREKTTRNFYFDPTSFIGIGMSEKKEGGSASMGTGSSISFGASTYAPNIQYPMVNNSVALSFKLGLHVFGNDVTLDAGGYYSVQQLATKNKSLPAFGYIHSEDGQDLEDAMMDFNREKDGAISQGMNTLPLPNLTYDVYSVTGQGMGGTFRPFRSDVGYVYDNEANTTSDSYSLGGEVSVTQTAHGGINLSIVDVNTRTGKWNQGNNMKNVLKFRKTGANATYEPSYFKEVGEKSVNDNPGIFNSIGKYDPARVKLFTAGPFQQATNQLEVQSATNSLNTQAVAQHQRTTRDKRNQVISYLTLDEAKDFGLQKNIYTNLISSSAKGHHIAEVTALRPDGMRYVYGLPAYNDTQEEVTFNISGSSQSGADAQFGQISYVPGTDDSKSNTRGIDNYYNKVTMPAYAHSYMLTAVLSPDYVDVSGDGPSPDDLGNYTVFTYTSVPDYEWRTPVSMTNGSARANYNEATKKAGPQDDQGNFVYGKKDLYYVTKIETKNYTALFETADREDGLQVDHMGKKITPSSSAHSMQYLKTITLYAKPDLDKQISSGGAYKAVPIKVAHFEYDYSLCSKVPNNSYYGSGSIPSGHGGKLTLKRVYFTYGTSNRAAFSKYEFKYGAVKTLTGTYHGQSITSTIDNNFAYDPKAYDRWGNYKPNTVTSAADMLATSATLPTSEFPYVDNENSDYAHDLAGMYASAWSLSEVDLPSGAKITVDYESDDYAYVQNKPAMSMFKIVGASDALSTPNISSAASVQTLMGAAGGNTNKCYLFFNLPYNAYASSAQEFKQSYVRDMVSANKYMYFRFLVNLTKQGSGSATQNVGDYFEYVSGYAQVDGNDCGTVTSGGTTYGYVKLKTVKINDNTASAQVNPICKAAWQYGRIHFPQVVWDATTQPGGGVADVVKSLLNSSITKNLIAALNVVGGPNAQLRDKDYGKEFMTHKSWIRLYEPSGHKLGGGCRVKKLVISDEWNTMTGQENSTYGQQYEYTKTENGKTISSGVAAYEPMIGGDENPWRQPNFYGKKGNALVPSDRFFNEEPFGETFFPSPTVGYSEVKVSNLKRTAATDQVNVTAHATGYVLHKFYTAKDYPVIVRRTQYADKHFKPPFASLFKILARDYYVASQGYSIELNDMHGKQKGMEVYAEGKPDPISKIEYYYKTEGNNGYTEPVSEDIFSNTTLRANRLENHFVTIDKAGVIHNEEIGVEYDAVADFRENKTVTIVGGAQINLSAFLVGIFPGIVPTIWPDFSREESRMRTAAFTKVINRYGVLSKTIAYDAGSRIETNNLAYDHETGELLLSQTQNEFEDKLYSFNYPAHWGYTGMGPAYTNVGVHFGGVLFTTGGISSPAIGTYFNVGDELAMVETGSNTKLKGWVCNTAPGSSISVIDANGLPVANGTYNIKVIRSGRRNQQSTNIGNLTTLINPIDIDNNGVLEPSINLTNSFARVIKTSAVEFGDKWQMQEGNIDQTPGNCGCQISAIGLNIYSFMSTLVTDHLFQNPLYIGGSPNFSSATVYSPTPVPAYSHGFSAALYVPGSMPNSNGLQWYCSPSSTSPNVANFGVACDPACFNSPVENCGHLIATLPSGLNWNAINITNLNSYSLITNTATCTSSLVICAAYTNTVASFVQPTTCFTVTSTGSCWPLAECKPTPPTNTICGKNLGDIVNPFVYGLRGNWRMIKSYAYLADRQRGSASGTNLRQDGYIVTKNSSGTVIPYQPYWKANSGNDWNTDPSYWTFATEATRYNQNGLEVENRDALNRYSSAVYGYNDLLPIAVASNAKYNQVGYDGFEDYDYIHDCTKRHFNFYEYKTYLDNTQSHTGIYSMKVSASTLQSISCTRKLITSPCTAGYSALCAYALTCKDFIGKFGPETYDPAIPMNTSAKYIVGYWVKEVPVTTGVQAPLNYTHSGITISLSGSPVALTLTSKSSVIDGWQRYEYSFDIPGGSAGDIKVTLNNTSTSYDSYFDDVRVHPYSGNIKTFVYNPVSLKYVAELDANNFATFYEYDEEGSLIRVKKETEKGIMTIQETKNHTKR